MGTVTATIEVGDPQGQHRLTTARRGESVVAGPLGIQPQGNLERPKRASPPRRAMRTTESFAIF